MKILNITPFLPWPLDTGGNIAQFAHIDYLRKRYEITLVVPLNDKSEIVHSKKLQEIWPEVNIIYACPLSFLLKKLMRYAINLMYLLKIFIKKILREFTFENLLTHCHLFPADSFFLASTVSRELHNSYDIIQVEFPHLLSLIDILPVRTKKIFVHYEIRYIRAEKQYTGANDSYCYKLIKSKELDYLNKYDAVFTMSENDKLILKKELPHKAIYSSPPGILDIKEKIDINQYEFNDKLIFIGSEGHYPNVDSIEWFLGEIWPLLHRKSRQLQFYIIGNWVKKNLGKYSSFKNVFFTGYLPDLSETMQGSIMIVPLRIGSGIRLKILEAMASGVPVISTSIGCEGIPTVNCENIIIADSTEDFITETIKLSNDNDLRLKLIKNGLETVRRNFSQNIVGERRNCIYQEVVSKSD